MQGLSTTFETCLSLSCYECIFFAKCSIHDSNNGRLCSSYSNQMISKKLLKIDIAGQFLIILSTLLFCLFRPAYFLVVILTTTFVLGCWQFMNGLVQVIAYQDKKRSRYLIVAILYVAGLIVLGNIYDNFYRDSNEVVWTKTFFLIYFFGGCLALASWYFYSTYRDLFIPKHPKTFWDYEF